MLSNHDFATDLATGKQALGTWRSPSRISIVESSHVTMADMVLVHKHIGQTA